MFRLVFVIFLAVLSHPNVAFAQGLDFIPIDSEAVIICPASAFESQPPAFTSENCQTVTAHTIDPHRKLIWIKTIVRLDRTVGPNNEPLAILISGKLAADVYLNGVLVGANGSPGQTRQTETPGLMDVVIHPPQNLFRNGKNEIILKASSQHGALALVHPIHWIGIGPAHNPTNTILSYYWPSLPTLGLFVLSAMYFFASSVFGDDRRSSLALLLICLFASGQVLAEVYRGLVPYTYPVHDIRLISITIFSAGFGVSLAYLTFNLFDAKRSWPLTIFAAALSLGSALLLSGFDQKAAGAMLAPMVLTLAFLALWSFQRRSRALAYFVIIFAFVVANVVFLSFFLDVVFFYMVAILLLVLLMERAIIAARDARQRKLEEARANRLELALEQAQQVDKAIELSIKSAGKMELITSDQIIRCQGAGGYTEILTLEGRTLLHSASLAEMEDILPATFIRVHRSYLVNTRHVQSLHRNQIGTGTLVLSNQNEVPVSRRIMPLVRQALG